MLWLSISPFCCSCSINLSLSFRIPVLSQPGLCSLGTGQVPAMEGLRTQGLGVYLNRFKVWGLLVAPTCALLCSQCTRADPSLGAQPLPSIATGGRASLLILPTTPPWRGIGVGLLLVTNPFRASFLGSGRSQVVASTVIDLCLQTDVCRWRNGSSN